MEFLTDKVDMATHEYDHADHMYLSTTMMLFPNNQPPMLADDANLSADAPMMPEDQATYMDLLPPQVDTPARFLDPLTVTDNQGEFVQVEDAVVEVEEPHICETERIVEGVEIVEKAASNHHTGIIRENYIENKRARQKTYSKRSKTLLRQAQLLHTMCGAKVSVTIESETGNIKSVSFPPIEKRNVKVQSGSAQIEWSSQKKTRASKPHHSPRKTATTATTTATKVIHNLPGKKKSKNENRMMKKRVNNKCKKCGIIYLSKADKTFAKEHGKKDSSWIGCDQEECGYWVHAICEGIKIPNLKSISSLTFLCPEHNLS